MKDGGIDVQVLVHVVSCEGVQDLCRRIGQCREDDDALQIALGGGRHYGPHGREQRRGACLQEYTIRGAKIAKMITLLLGVILIAKIELCVMSFIKAGPELKLEVQPL